MPSACFATTRLLPLVTYTPVPATAGAEVIDPLIALHQRRVPVAGSYAAGGPPPSPMYTRALAKAGCAASAGEQSARDQSDAPLTASSAWTLLPAPMKTRPPATIGAVGTGIPVPRAGLCASARRPTFDALSVVSEELRLP